MSDSSEKSFSNVWVLFPGKMSGRMNSGPFEATKKLEIWNRNTINHEVRNKSRLGSREAQMGQSRLFLAFFSVFRI